MTAVPSAIGVIAHARRKETVPVANYIVRTLRERGVETWMEIHWDKASVEDIRERTDIIIAIGGDGAMLRAARTCAQYDIPVLGVNMGYLGFLPEINSPDDWEHHLEKLLSGDFWIERRMTIEASLVRDGETKLIGAALNDIVLNRDRAIGTVLLQTYIDGYWTTTYHADALIIATATGSTAYALAAGGPILPPELRNILIVPVAPHLSMDRPIVLSEGATVQVTLSPERGYNATVVVDGGELCDIHPGDYLLIQAGENEGQFVRMRNRNYFYRSLLDRLEPRVPLRATPDQLHLDVTAPDGDE